jgi:hypothetical protein
MAFRILLILSILFFIMIQSLIVADVRSDDDWGSPEAIEQTITTGQSGNAVAPSNTNININNQQATLDGRIQIDSGKITFAEHLTVNDVELWNARDVEITADGIIASSADKVVIKDSLTAYQVTGFEYDLDSTATFQSADSVRIREYHFPNVQDATFVLNGDGSLQSVDLTASKKTDYILPNPLWLPFAANQEELNPSVTTSK